MKVRNYIRLPLTNVSNCRDLGGYAALDNSVTKWRRFLRSSDLTSAEANDKELIYDYGVRTVIDLRSQREIDSNPNPFVNYKDVQYYHVNLLNIEGIDKSRYENIDTDSFLSTVYVGLLKEQTQVKEVLSIILNSTDGVLYHCSAGKDRTGVISMLLLGLMGVSRQDILTNYEVSYTYINETLNEELSNYPLNILKSDPQNINTAYEYIIDNYGAFTNYYKELGFSENILKNFINSVTY